MAVAGCLKGGTTFSKAEAMAEILPRCFRRTSPASRCQNSRRQRMTGHNEGVEGANTSDTRFIARGRLNSLDLPSWRSVVDDAGRYTSPATNELRRRLIRRSRCVRKTRRGDRTTKSDHGVERGLRAHEKPKQTTQTWRRRFFPEGVGRDCCTGSIHVVGGLSFLATSGSTATFLGGRGSYTVVVVG